MSEQIIKRSTGNAAFTGRTRVRTTVQMGMLGAVAVVLMLFEFPIPFLAPPFYQFDLSEIPVLIGCFAMGPWVGAGIELIKILLNLVINGTVTAGVGEMANFLIGCSFIVPAGLIYRAGKTRKSALIGMGVGTLVMTVVGCFLNAYVLLPTYGAAFGLSVDSLVNMGASLNSAINNVFTFVVLSVAPFNLLKGLVVSIITLLLYKRIRVLLKGE